MKIDLYYEYLSLEITEGDSALEDEEDLATVVVNSETELTIYCDKPEWLTKRQQELLYAFVLANKIKSFELNGHFPASFMLKNVPMKAIWTLMLYGTFDGLQAFLERVRENKRGLQDVLFFADNDPEVRSRVDMLAALPIKLPKCLVDYALMDLDKPEYIGMKLRDEITLTAEKMWVVSGQDKFRVGN